MYSLKGHGVLSSGQWALARCQVKALRTSGMDTSLAVEHTEMIAFTHISEPWRHSETPGMGGWALSGLVKGATSGVQALMRHTDAHSESPCGLVS